MKKKLLIFLYVCTFVVVLNAQLKVMFVSSGDSLGDMNNYMINSFITVFLNDSDCKIFKGEPLDYQSYAEKYGVDYVVSVSYINRYSKGVVYAFVTDMKTGEIVFAYQTKILEERKRIMRIAGRYAKAFHSEFMKKINP